MSLTFSTFFCDSGLSAPPKMVHSVFFCAACGSGERKATAPFWVSSLHSPIHWMIHPHSFAREFMLIPAFVHTSSFHLVVLSYLPSVLRSVYCWFLFQQISILSVHRLIQLIHSSTQRAALATRPLFAWLVCVPLGNGCFNECSWLGLSVLYLSSIHKVSTKYPQSIHKVSTKYPQSIHKVSIKYPSSRNFLSISGSHFSCKPHVKADFLRRLHFSPQCGDPHLGDQHRWLGLPRLTLSCIHHHHHHGGLSQGSAGSPEDPQSDCQAGCFNMFQY